MIPTMKATELRWALSTGHGLPSAMLVQCRSIADAHVTAAFLATRSFTVIADSNNALVLEVHGPQPSTIQTF